MHQVTRQMAGSESAAHENGHELFAACSRREFPSAETTSHNPRSKAHGCCPPGMPSRDSECTFPPGCMSSRLAEPLLGRSELHSVPANCARYTSTTGAAHCHSAAGIAHRGKH